TSNFWQLEVTPSEAVAHTYHAVLVDAAGNLGNASSDFTLTVDTVAPTTTATFTQLKDQFGLNADNGESGSDFTTNVRNLVFGG
ncbi:hypothetical protein, partial [Mesorhizobium japonicum]|uniref:hypothetical protein n=1 Tax=Mesorhizobium japonicum TaxID=2066070 RepID=UPI003B5B11CF